MRWGVLIVVGLIGSAAWAAAPPTSGPAPVLRAAGTIPLGEVAGRIDHLAADPDGHRLFVAALGNNSVEVVDITGGKVLESIKGFKEPQGLAFNGYVYVASGGTGRVDAIQEDYSVKQVTTLPGGDADNLRIDLERRVLMIGYAKALRFWPLDKDSEDATVPLDGHPEAFAFEGGGKRIYVNVPSGEPHIVVIDRPGKKVLARWKLTEAAENYPMALDEARGRLFVGCRKPAKLIIKDTQTGKTVAEHALGRDCDDLFYDANTRRIYAICGEGQVDVFWQKDADTYRRLGAIKTAPGTRTGLLVPSWSRLVVAVPARGEQKAELRMFDSVDKLPVRP